MKRFAAGFLLSLAALGGCSAQSGAQAGPAGESTAPAAHPVSGLSIIPLQIESEGGKTHSFRVELADTTMAQTRGLMFREKLGPDEGMLFPSIPPSTRSFWMKNTPLPLDIIFIGIDGTILNIERGVPQELEPVVSEGVTSGVLELAGGRAAELGIQPGDRVTW